MVSDLAKKTGVRSCDCHLFCRHLFHFDVLCVWFETSSQETIRLSVDLDEDDVSLAEMEMLARLEGEQQSNADDEVKEES